MKKIHFSKITLIITYIILAVSVVGFVGIYKYKIDMTNNFAASLNLFKKDRLINQITARYNEYVITKNDAPLYKKDGDEYVEVGKIGKDFKLKLDNIKIDENTLYFPITNLKDEYYISYLDVVRCKEFVTKNFDQRYKYYIPFNKNVVTTDKSILYSGGIYDEGSFALEVPESINLPILIMDGDKYFVDYNDSLYYVLKDDITEVKDSNNTSERVATEIPVTAYHFIYDPEKDGACNQIICHTVSQVRSHLDYLKSENYYTLSLEEFELWIDGKINMPVRSVVMTLDDGPYGWNARDIYNEYEMRLNMFLVSSWFGYEEFLSDYSGVYSHTDSLHVTDLCPGYGYQGSGLLCLSHETLVNDFKTSREKFHNTKALAYPFYGVNNHTIEAMKEAGFTMGFAGTRTPMRRGMDKYRIPRYTLLNSTSVSDLANIIKR